MTNQRCCELRAGRHKGVILASFPTGINARLLKDLDQFFAQSSPQPFRLRTRVLNTGENGGISACQKFSHQLTWRLTPQRLPMDKAGGGTAFLVPGPYIGQVDIAKKERGNFPLA